MPAVGRGLAFLQGWLWKAGVQEVEMKGVVDVVGRWCRSCCRVCVGESTWTFFSFCLTSCESIFCLFWG